MFDWLKQSIRIFKSDDFMRNPNAPQLSESDKKALLVGLINSEQLTAYCDSLTTGLPNERVMKGLNEAWDIYNPQDAVSTLDWILSEGHRITFQEVLPLLKITDSEERNNTIHQLINEQYQQAVAQVEDENELSEIRGEFENKLGRAIEFAENLTECVKGRGNDKFVAFNEENINKGILAWDLGRLVTVSRLAFDAGYIDEATAWEYIRAGYKLAAQEFTTWKALATSYLIGRGAWGGDTMMLNGLYGIAESSVNDEKSPWKEISLI